MKLGVDALAKAGGFAGGPVRKDITWENDGETYEFRVYVRRFSYHSAMAEAASFGTSQGAAAARIASCLLNEEGKPIFQMSDITGMHDNGNPVYLLDDNGGKIKDEEGKPVERGPLDASLAGLLMAAIAEVNGLGKNQGKSTASTQSESSGTS